MTTIQAPKDPIISLPAFLTILAVLVISLICVAAFTSCSQIPLVPWIDVEVKSTENPQPSIEDQPCQNQDTQKAMLIAQKAKRKSKRSCTNSRKALSVPDQNLVQQSGQENKPLPLPSPKPENQAQRSLEQKGKYHAAL